MTMRIFAAVGCGSAVAFLAIYPMAFLSSLRAPSPALTPWVSVGTCGAGGSGGSGCGNAKWIGMGVTGGLLDVQTLCSECIGQNFPTQSLSTRLTIRPRGDTQIGLTIPLVQKTGEAQPKTTGDSKTFQTGGLGDIILDVSQLFGMAGEFSVGLSLTFPTGQYNIKRPWNKIEAILPTSLQKGTGLVGTTLSLGYVKDVEDGMWLIDASYSHPMALRLVSGENEFLDEYYGAYKDSTNNKRFYYRFKPYGENDLGDYMPPSVLLSVYYGNKSIAGFTFSWGATFSVPIGVAWIHEENYYPAAGYADYKPRPDPDHKAWNATLNFGMEADKPEFPFFVAISLPVHDPSASTAGYANELDAYDTEPLARWDAPDWKDLFHQWAFSLGFRATML